MVFLVWKGLIVLSVTKWAGELRKRLQGSTSIGAVFSEAEDSSGNSGGYS